MPQPIVSLKRLTGEEADHVDVNAIDYLRISARKLQRSINFYVRVFGFQIIESGRDPRDPHVLLRSARGDVHLAVHEHRHEAIADTRPPTRWSFIVRDLDGVRETVWNLGVAAGGTDEPRRIQPWRKARSFVIRDPDGHEIELVEATSAARKPASPQQRLSRKPEDTLPDEAQIGDDSRIRPSRASMRDDGENVSKWRLAQHNAINTTLEAIGLGRDRILLTLATGTGKTAIAFQLAWKLFHARWSLAAPQTVNRVAGRASRFWPIVHLVCPTHLKVPFVNPSERTYDDVTH